MQQIKQEPSQDEKKQEILKIFLQDPIFAAPSTRQTNPLVIENE